MRLHPLHLSATLGLFLANCAGVTAVPVTYHGQAKPEAEGIRYYMPKPYLLVSRLPKVVVADKPKRGSNKTLMQNGGGSSAPSKGDEEKDDSEKSSGASAAASSTSELSYQVGNDTYVLKLIYLPDMSKSMALKITPSILGSVSAQPQLQDGWMLTSLQASADNSKAIESFTTLATALIGGGGSAVAGSGDKSITALRERTQVAAAEDVLPPGLYEFQYDDYGHLLGLCAVNRFKSTGVFGPDAGIGCKSVGAILRARG